MNNIEDNGFATEENYNVELRLFSKSYDGSGRYGPSSSQPTGRETRINTYY